MRPANLKTKIFLDGGDPAETREAIDLLGFLDGQTTNPTLISKNPQVMERITKGEKFKKEEIFEYYKKIVQEISLLIPDGSISVEVPSDKDTLSTDMLEIGKKMYSWIPNAHIKFPTSKEGLVAAENAVHSGIRVNMTLCFSQQQAAAIYSATKRMGSEKNSLAGFKNVFVSPFVGRLDDIGDNGMDLIKNIIQMYKEGDHHVAVLTASVRNLNHFLNAVALGSDIITAPLSVLREWVQNGLQMPDDNFTFKIKTLRNIPYEELDLNKDWNEFDVHDDLTDQGLEKFSNDWNALVV